jgi:murein DD-endopeptidase MepM/ murein hydrolase activator NlpD
MISNIRTVFLAGIVLVVGLLGFRTYHYFFDTTTPMVELRGLDANGSYAGNIQCVLNGNDGYKVSDISIWLDNAPLISNFKINRRSFDHPFTINSQALANGKHTLRLEAVSGTYQKNKAVDERIFYVDNTALQVAFVRPAADLKVFQGRTLHLQFQANKEIKSAEIKAFSRTFECFQESAHSLIYEAFIPIECEEKPNEYLLSVNITDKVGNTQLLEDKFQVILYPFKKQTLTIDSAAVQKEKEIGIKQAVLNDRLKELTTASPKEKLWHGAFCIPLDMTCMTCDFGMVRTTKERGRYMHKAVDFGARKKSVVWASQNGVVVIKDRYSTSGNTIVIDHGYGIYTLYAHLDSFTDINVGDRVEKGNPIGIMGKTGYATGDHLHWEMHVNNVQVDPMQWTKQNF